VLSFIVENVSLPPEVEKAIDKRSSMAAIGNLNDYVKLQMAEAVGRGDGGGGGATATTAAQLAAGLAMGQQMMQSLNTPPSLPASATAAAAPAAALPELLTPADVAKALGVTEADVMASLTAGELKGKKIGSAWRITRAALDEFLRS